ncbi:protein of unknown function [Streptococcus thermophilus]|nr:protein of unknown function [Streptococcus thermophilus]CAD0125817.1 protein of unknown function [Streptococcus thermophilus]CAD0128348.1 protein of unknown function [Streptococcus thermophilus]CAD0133784.1 protein of unknown function [Streptococcus thermophilus]CAD0136165.1 protein of unknown function [Streptococcus thermophilus]
MCNGCPNKYINCDFTKQFYYAIGAKITLKIYLNLLLKIL